MNPVTTFPCSVSAMSEHAVTFGVTLPVFDSLGAGIPSVAESARRAEALGLHSVWAGDHLFFHRPNLECLVAIAAAAGATTTLGLGTGVLLPALRQPIVLAKQLATLQIVSGGRLSLGIGVGGEFGPEWEAAAVDPSERGSRTDDFVDFFTLCATGDAVDFQGETFAVTCPPMRPMADEVPTIWVGGRSEAALRRTARIGDGWLSVWSSPGRIREARAELDELAKEFQRPPPRIGMVVFVNLGALTEARAEAEEFVTKHYDLPFKKMDKWFLLGEVDQVAADVSELQAAGVDHFVIYPAAGDPSAQFEAVREMADLVLENPT